MRAITYNRYGAPDALSLTEIACPEPKHNEVLVRVRACSLNPWDWDKLRGRPWAIRLIDGAPIRPANRVLGSDVAGIVEAVGADVSQWRPGDRVFGDLSSGGWGCLAEFAIAKSDELAAIPPEVGFDEAASLPQAGQLALQGLRDVGGLSAGQDVLINGAGGGVGTLAIQIAKQAGARVTAIDRADKLARLSALGADEVLDFTQIDYRRIGKSWDLILEPVMQHRAASYRICLKRGGTFVMVGGKMRHLPALAWATYAQRRNPRRLRIVALKQLRADLNYLIDQVCSGQLVPAIDTTFSLDNAPGALLRLGQGDMFGKLVICP